MKIRAVVYEEEDGYWAKVPSLPGLYTQADTLEELEANVREAIELYLSNEPEPLPEEGQVMEIAL
ncbi:MAG: type II toxin-antitoxin system HicB family antitoxin [Thermomicrobiales bacterium]|jgi:predicted RNase H-like HicB family nuclease